MRKVDCSLNYWDFIVQKEYLWRHYFIHSSYKPLRSSERQFWFHVCNFDLAFGPSTASRNCVYSLTGTTESPWCGLAGSVEARKPKWPWAALKCDLEPPFCSLLSIPFTLAFSQHDATFLLTPQNLAPTHSDLPSLSPLHAPWIKQIHFLCSNQSLPMLTCFFQCFLCAICTFLCRDVTRFSLLPLSMAFY